MDEEPSFECKHCNNIFYRKSNLYRHFRNIHKIDTPIESTKKNHIKCVLCSLDQVSTTLSTYKEYNNHLEETHEVIVQKSALFFTSKDEFDSWREKDKRDVNYTCRSYSKAYSRQILYYDCNRTKSKEYQSKMRKKGGSIKIPGACPSRIVATFEENGKVTVQFFETHVGHDEEVRAQRLTKKEQLYLAEQLKSGVPKKKIISNARSLNMSESGVPGRLNSIDMNDLRNISRRYNVVNVYPPEKRKNQKSKEQPSQGVEEVPVQFDHLYSVNLNSMSSFKETKENCDITDEISNDRQLYREHCINLVNQMCLVNEDSYNLFQVLMQSLEVQMHEDLEIKKEKYK